MLCAWDTSDEEHRAIFDIVFFRVLTINQPFVTFQHHRWRKYLYKQRGRRTILYTYRIWYNIYRVYIFIIMEDKMCAIYISWISNLFVFSVLCIFPLRCVICNFQKYDSKWKRKSYFIFKGKLFNNQIYEIQTCDSARHNFTMRFLYPYCISAYSNGLHL